MTKHTQGEWKVASDDKTLVFAPTLARPVKCYSEERARLIAAAPQIAAERDRLKEVNAKLLEVLELSYTALYELADDLMNGAKGRDVSAKMREKAMSVYAAIASAKGE